MVESKRFAEKNGFKISKGDEAYYYKHDGENLKGMVLSHVDDFLLSGDSNFITETIDIVTAELKVSKVERDHFRFTGVDIVKHDTGITMSMNEYASSIEDLGEIRNVSNDEKLSKQEMLQKIHGKNKLVGCQHKARSGNSCFGNV